MWIVYRASHVNQSLHVKAKRGSENTIKKQGFKLQKRKKIRKRKKKGIMVLLNLGLKKLYRWWILRASLAAWAVMNLWFQVSSHFLLIDSKNLESLNENNLRIEDLGIENILLEHYTTNLMESLVLLSD